MQHDTELRKLPLGALYGIANILEINDDWKKVVSLIPKNPQSERFEPKYNEEHIRLIANHAREGKKRCAEVLFDEWGTSGRIRPTLGILKNIFLQAGIYRAADEVSYMLNEEPATRPDMGPAAPITTNITLLINGEATTMEQKLSLNYITANHMNKISKNNYVSDEGMGNQTTAQMKSASDLIQFSKPTVSKTAEKKTNEVQALESMNIPNFSALLNSSTNNAITAEFTTENYCEPSVPSSNNSVQGAYSPNAYQTSFPNIDIHSGIDSSILESTDVIYFQYTELEMITNNFSKDLMNSSNGLTGRIGQGGFGEVFVGVHNKYGQLAIKKAHKIHQHEISDLPVKLFNTEVKFLLQFRHHNIVPIIGVSIDGPDLFIVCEYIDGGSLDRKLEEKILNEKQRIDIIIGIADGLKYLHNNLNIANGNRQSLESNDLESTKRNKFVHGDIKSANILLTKDFVAKICDFGLAKQNYATTFITSCPVGTLGYLPPEAQVGTITQKMDIYSFGIVMLELLTGLKVIIDNNSEKIHIKDYIEETCTDDIITEVLDPSVDKWTKSEDIYKLSKMCLHRDRKRRPSIDEICDILCKL